MAGYLLSRVAWAVGTALAAVLVVFLIFHLLPGADPAVLRAGRSASPEEIERIRESMGLTEPIWTQFWIYLKNLAAFDLGYSFHYRAPVSELITNRLPVTAYLVIGAAIGWLFIGIGAGLISAIRNGTKFDHGVMLISLALISAPIFWLGLLSLYLFGRDIGVFIPVFPGSGAWLDAETVPEHLAALLLPWAVMAVASGAIYARYVRSSMIETMSSGYVRTARAKGLPERAVIQRHGMRGALVPVVTLLGIDIGTVLAGNAILTETVFNLPGVGRLVATGIERADLPLIQGVVLVGALFIILANLIVDLVYAWLDPRVRPQ